MWVGIGIGINRNRYAKGIFNAYSARVVADGGVTEAGQCVDAGATTLLQTASLLLIPSGYKGGKLYSEIPTNGNGDFTWTRASDGTRTNASGVIQRMPWNLLQRSEEFMNAIWSKSNISITANTTTSPNGTLTADTISIGVDASAVRHRLSQGITATIGTTYTGTYYLKANQHQWIQIVGVTGFSINVWANFDLVNGTIGNTGGVDTTASIEDVGDGWYRCRVGGVATATSTTGFEILTTNNTNSGRYPSYQSLVAEDVCYVWGAQIVEGSAAQTYLPTTDRLGFPRLDYSFGSCPGVMIEGQRTNLALYSAQFDDAYWSKLNSTLTANTVTSPDGTTNADTFTADGSNNFHLLQSQLTINFTTVAFSASVYVKKNTNDFIQLSVGSSVGGMFANFNINNGTLGSVGTVTGTNPTSSIQNVGNGWYRCVMNFTPTLATATAIQFGIITSATSPRIESNTLTTSVYVYGSQVEAGAFATTYIPTTTATATRLVDTCNKTGISSLIGQTEGTFYAEIIASTAQTVIRAIGTIVSGGNYTRCRITAGNGLSLETFVGGSFVGQITAGLVVNGKNKVAFSYKNGEISSMFLNGTLVGSTPTVTTNPTGSELRIGMDNFNVSQPFNLINQVALFTTRLTTAQCQALTTL